MNIKKIKSSLIIFTSILYIYGLNGCSSSQESTQENTGRDTSGVYIFDKVPADTTINFSEPEGFPPFNKTFYIVQIGAFTTKDHAEKFAEKSQSELEHKVSISFNPQINLYVVQLSPFYETRTDAEQMRDKLWKMEDYKDSWIVTVNK
jgi:SPOR domain